MNNNTIIDICNNENTQHSNTNIEYLFMNPSLIQKIQKQTIIQDKMFEKKEYRFYKKRILQLFKDIMNKKIENNDLIDAYNIFVLQSIDYLKNVDKTDILQKDYNRKNVHFNLDEQPTRQEQTQEQTQEQDIPNIEIDKLLYKNNNETKHLRIDKLLNIERKRIIPKKEIVLPKQKELNLQDPKLKTKGIKTKHKNKETNKEINKETNKETNKEINKEK